MFTIPKSDSRASSDADGYLDSDRPSTLFAGFKSGFSSSAASRAGVTSEDTIVSIDGQQVRSAEVKGVWTLERDVKMR